MNQPERLNPGTTLVSKVHDFLAAAKVDFASALALLSEDVRWINRLPDNVPFGGDYLGREGVARYFQLMAETFELGEHDLTTYDFIEAGNTLVIVGCERGGKAKPTGVVFDLEFVWVVRFDEQGRISYLREHNDTAAIGAAFTARVS